jgi:hypothetical protein
MRKIVSSLRFPKPSPGCLWTGVGAAIGAGLVAAVLVATSALHAIRGGPAAPAPVVTILVLPTPTATLIPVPTSTQTPTAAPSPTLDPSAGVAFRVGDLAEVTGTGGEGLRLRSEPDLEAPINLVAVESEVFEVREAPREADGYWWVYLVNPFDPTMNGWAVAAYLRLLGTQ